MNLLEVLVVLLAADAKPGPMDAYRANYAAIKADTDFTYEWSRGDKSSMPIWADRFTPGCLLATTTLVAADGRWSCDGTSEHYVLLVTNDKMSKQVKVAGESMIKNVIIKSSEIICDATEETIIHHELNARGDSLQVVQSGSSPISMVGPLAWWLCDPYPWILRAEFSNASPIRKNFLIGNIPTEMEIYRTELPGGWNQVEVAYDPKVGYLPRYMRAICSNPNGVASVKELYLLDAQPTAGGGFIPSEWFDASYRVDAFPKRYPAYEPAGILVPTSSVSFGHLKIKRNGPLLKPVALDQLSKVRAILASGKHVIIEPGTQTLTLDEVKSRIGGMGAPVSPKMPHLDKEEIKARSTSRTSPSLGVYALGILGITGSGFAIIYWKRHRTLSVVLCFGLLNTGCSRPQPPEIKLSASFTKRVIIYDVNEPTLSLHLQVINAGNVPVMLFKISGGCSCRVVDQSRFPLLLAPHDRVELAVKMNDKRQYDVQNITFGFETNTGLRTVTASLLALPRHHVSPSTLAMALVADTYVKPTEIVHRQIYSTAYPKESVKVAMPPEFKAKLVRNQGGIVSEAEGYFYEDSTYELLLNDDTVGLHKSAIFVKNLDGMILVDIPIIWNRQPFLSSTPERVSLGNNSVRVFLRCPDESVELKSVLSAPKGVSATIVSPREITLRLLDPAPNVIDGIVEVSTTALQQPSLRIPIARYAPLVQR